jgi:hypothetical protein
MLRIYVCVFVSVGMCVYLCLWVCVPGYVCLGGALLLNSVVSS